MFTVKINTDNEAFGEVPEDEIGRILRTIADEVTTKGCEQDFAYLVRDVNGNKVGTYELNLF